MSAIELPNGDGVQFHGIPAPSASPADASPAVVVNGSSHPQPSLGARRASEAELIEAEFRAFRKFRAAMKELDALPLVPATAANTLPPNLANPTYAGTEEASGYLSQQFPSVGNPAPVGLCGFALTTFVLSMHNAGAGVNASDPHGVVFGLALFYGGLVQFIAGLWELRVGNTFGAVAFTSYGGFWMAFAAMQIKAFGFLDAYAGDAEALRHSLALFLLAWCIFSCLMTIAAHRTTVVLFALFFSVALTFLLLCIGEWADSIGCTRAGGVVGLVASALAWYAAMAAILTKKNSLFLLPVWDLNERLAKFALHRTPSVVKTDFSKV